MSFATIAGATPTVAWTMMVGVGGADINYSVVGMGTDADDDTGPPRGANCQRICAPAVR